MVLIQLIDLACLPMHRQNFPGYSISLNKDWIPFVPFLCFRRYNSAVTVEVKLYGFQLPNHSPFTWSESAKWKGNFHQSIFKGQYPFWNLFNQLLPCTLFLLFSRNFWFRCVFNSVIVGCNVIDLRNNYTRASYQFALTVVRRLP
jgi:hypothetical protein